MEKIGKYEILEELGKGGMGVVYKAYDPQIDREVAIKVILEKSLDIPEIKARFYREARTAGRLSHENIAIVHDLGEIDGKTYIVMEYLGGADLRSIIDNNEPLKLEQKLEYAKQICRGLQYAHSQNIIHRDIKPENIKILENGRVKIIDFGIAKPVMTSAEASQGTVLTQVGTRVGTPWYMSPEQIRGLAIDRRTDIFSFGVLLYEFLTYKKPFEGDDTTVLYKIVHEEPAKINLEESGLVDELQVILSKCLEKEPDARYADCGVLAKDLVAILEKLQQEKKINQLLAEAQTLTQQKKFNEAIVKFNEILKIDANHPEANSNIKKLIDRGKESANAKVLTGQINGEVISHFKIIDRLDRGGMGVVYKAEDITLKRTVALKFLSPDLTRDEASKKRFFKEAQTASALDHPNICTIHEINETEDGLLFICMSYYQGQDLRELIDKGRLDELECLNIVTKIAKGLAKAHEHGIVHRDIKPANIILTSDGEIKIVDFGLAKLTSGMTRITQTGMTIGTLPFMSPEQVKGLDLDHRTDIWSLGVLLYELLTGQLPFEGEYQAAILYSIVNKDPIPVSELRKDISLELMEIINKALKKDVTDRYPSMQAMLEDLEGIQMQLINTQQLQNTQSTYLARLIENGKDYLEEQKYEKALSKFEEAQQLDPKNQELSDLITHYKGILKESQSIEKLLQAGRTARQKGKLSQAERVFSEILTLAPDNLEAKQALQEIEKHQEVEKLSAEAKQQLKQENFVKTIELCQQILAIQPDNETAQKNLQKAQEGLNKRSGKPTVVMKTPPPQRVSKLPWIGLLIVILIAGAAGGGWYFLKNSSSEALQPEPEPEHEKPVDAAELSKPAGVAKQEMLSLRSEAEKVEADTKASEIYQLALQDVQKGEEEFTNQNYETAQTYYTNAADNFKKAIDEVNRQAVMAEQDLNKIQDLVTSVQQEMLKAKGDVEKSVNSEQAKKSFQQALNKETSGDKNFKTGTKESLMLAQKDYTAARDLYKQAGKQAERLTRLRNSANAAKAAMVKVKGQVPGSEAEKNQSANYSKATKSEAAGLSQLRAGDFETAAASFATARDLYTESQKEIVNLFKNQAEAEKSAMTTIKSKISKAYTDDAKYKDAMKIETRGNSAYADNNFNAAEEEFRNAKSLYNDVLENIERQKNIKNAAQAEFQNIGSKLKASLENRDLDRLKEVMNLSKDDQKLWSGFFSDVKNIKVQVENQNLQINEENAKADYLINISYIDKRDRQQENNLVYTWTLQNQNGSWSVAKIAVKN